MGRFTSVDPLAEKYYGISSYAYCANNPVMLKDPTGKYIETAWDIASLAMGVESLVSNVKEGNVGGAIADGVGIVLDAAAVAFPLIPGGAGVAIKAARGVDKALDVAKTTDKATDAVKKVEKVGDGVKKIGPAGDAGGTVMKQLPEAMQSNASMSKSSKGGGTIYKDPANPKGNHVRVESGNPNSPNPAQNSPYVKETKNGRSIDKNGKPTSPELPEAHIPKDEYKYNK